MTLMHVSCWIHCARRRRHCWHVPTSQKRMQDTTPFSKNIRMDIKTLECAATIMFFSLVAVYDKGSVRENFVPNEIPQRWDFVRGGLCPKLFFRGTLSVSQRNGSMAYVAAIKQEVDDTDACQLLNPLCTSSSSCGGAQCFLPAPDRSYVLSLVRS